MTQKVGRLSYISPDVIVLGWYYTLYLDDRVFFIDPDLEVKMPEHALVLSKSSE
jgi:hypothetical protein